MRNPGLPTELTTFIGRGQELDQVVALTDTARLVTLTGAGGTGKTRLAMALARERRSQERPIHWVELAPLRDPGLVAPAVAEAVGLGEELRGGGVVALARLLRDHDALLVLDNCEHLVDTCAELAHGLLAECADLSILATSREALGVPGERAWLVPPLSLPTDDTDAATCEAVRLFVERARDVAPAFALDASSLGTVSEICRKLDGIPLAIELAAARVKAIAPAEILARLDNVFVLLTSGQRIAVPRHRTLRATIDWSHELLPDAMRLLLRRLAVFRGGFTLDAAERVGPGGAIGQSDVLNLVSQLVDRSLLSVREQNGFARYQLLESVRQYATEKLVESGEESEVRAAHARWLLERVEEAAPHFIRQERRAWVDRLYPEMDNLRSALGWTRDQEPHLHVRLVGQLWWFWFSTRHWTEAARWIQEALELPAAAEPGLERAALLFAAGALAALQVRSDAARPALRESAEMAARFGDAQLEAYATNYLGMTFAGEGRVEAVELCRRAEDWFRAHDDLYGLRLASLLQGSFFLAAGQFEDAERMNREGVRVARLFGQDRELAVALQNLAAVQMIQGRLDDAEALVREALAASRRDPSYYFIAMGVAYLGEIQGLRGRPLVAARLLGAAEGIRNRVGATAFPLDARRVEKLIPTLRQAALDVGGAEAFDAAWDDGRALSPELLLDELAVREVGDAPEPSGPLVPAPAEPAAPGGTKTTGEPALRVDVLGPLVVHVDGVRLGQDQFAYAKPRELLVYLLLEPAGAPRDRIGEALWPGAARSNVKNSFHVTLHHLRKALEHPEWVVLDGDRYRLDPSLRYTFDVNRFVEAAKQASSSGDSALIRSTLALYRGELLEGDPAGRWIEDHRDRLRRMVVELNLALGASIEDEDPAGAARLYEALAAREELDENVHRQLMAIWARSGERVRALRHYERVRELLRSELKADPEPETVELWERIRAG